MSESKPVAGREAKAHVSLEDEALAIVPSRQPTFLEVKASFHVFLSYRVNTDAGLTATVYDKLLVQCMSEDSSKMPPDGRLIRPFLDKKCLVDGEKWEDGFSNGLVNSRVFVPFLTWHGEDGGSVGAMSHLNPTQGKDWCDNVLLELELALALLAHRPDDLFKIFPVLLGPADSRGYTEFPFGHMQKLSDAPSRKTKAMLVKHCKAHGIPLTERDLQRSVRATVQAVLENQGVRMWAHGEVGNADEQASKQILKKAVEAMGGIKTSSLGEEEVQKKEITLGRMDESLEQMKEHGCSFLQMWGAGHSCKDIRRATGFSRKIPVRRGRQRRRQTGCDSRPIPRHVIPNP